MKNQYDKQPSKLRIAGNLIAQKSFIALVCLLLAIYSVADTSVAEPIPEVITFCEDPWPPYTYGNVGHEPQGGIAVKLVKLIFSNLNYHADLKLYPWKRCLAQMKTGERDALMLLGYSNEREKYLTYSTPVVKVQDLIWFHKDKVIDWETFEDIKHLTFGRTAGFQYGEEFEQAIKRSSIRVDQANTDLLNFKKLTTGRIDAFIANESTAAEIFRTHPELRASLASAPKPLKEGPLYLGFSKQSPALAILPEVNQVIHKLKDNGDIERLFFGE